MLDGKTIGILGAGKLGESLIRGLLRASDADPRRIVASRLHVERLEPLVHELGIVAASSSEVAARADILILCVKPQDMPRVLDGIRQPLRDTTLVISVAACTTTEAIEKALDKNVPVVRTMPNTPCLLGSGMTALSAGKNATPQHLDAARAIFDSVGRTVLLPERLMDAVTGLSGSGPAYIYIVIEALAEAGVKVGLPRNVATELVAQTVLGSARMVLETGQHPALLKDMVTTPAGCTMDGILALEDGGIRVTLIKAVVEATRRASELVAPPTR